MTSSNNRSRGPEQSMEDFRDLKATLVVVGALVLLCLLPLAV